MPELPEVETIKRDLSRVLIGKEFAEVQIMAEKSVRPITAVQFRRSLKHRKIGRIERRAKLLFITLDDRTLGIHLKMTGQLIYVAPGKQVIVGGHPQPGGLENLPNRYTRVVFNFTDGSKLFFNDLRKFGWIRLFNQTELDLVTSTVGVEPLSSRFTAGYLTSLTKRYPKRATKQLLLDQALIAGIGNIYADESCYLAKVLPMRPAGTLSNQEVRRLHQAIVSILKLAIQKKGTSSRNYVRASGKPGGFVPYLKVYGRGKKKCGRCGTLITKAIWRGRGTHFCSQCQKPYNK